ncbi:MAG: copper chaperone PCu(A)C [Balneolaceae bacterium]
MYKLYAALFTAFLLLTSCGSGGEEESESFRLDGEGIEVEGAWARPGSEGRMSAAYLLITNFDETADTLASLESDASQLTELHESYEMEEGMSGMREVELLVIPPRSTVRLEPGGLHVMLIQLLHNYSEGDVIELTLEFTGGQTIPVTVPIRP